MVRTTTTYLDDLHCKIIHEPSQAIVETDAPVDNNGRGACFSPTDMVGAALASCMMTIMGIVAKRNNINLSGARIIVDKHMNANPRRIGKLDVTVEMPLCESHPDKELLKRAALSCPVKQSLHPDIEIPVTWVWQTDEQNGG